MSNRRELYFDERCEERETESRAFRQGKPKCMPRSFWKVDGMMCEAKYKLL